jgi:hypothetical protein
VEDHRRIHDPTVAAVTTLIPSQGEALASLLSMSASNNPAILEERHLAGDRVAVTPLVT